MNDVNVAGRVRVWFALTRGMMARRGSLVRARVLIPIVPAVLCAGLTPSTELRGDPGGEAARRSTPDLSLSVESARPGDTLLIGPGTYAGNLLLRKRLTLIGAGKPVIRGDGTGSVITVQADSCVIEGLIIEHCGPMLVGEDAGILIRSDGNIVRGNELRDILFGIYLLHAEGNLVTGNTIAGGRALSLGEKGSGIHIWNSQGNRFAGNTITGVRDGFYIQNASHSRLEDNAVFGVRYGLHYMYADSNVFLGNRFYDNVAGAAIMYSTGIMMRDNVFARNRGFSSFGVLFQDCHGLVAEGNVVVDNNVGMFFEASTDNRFCGNLVAQNDVALEMFQNATGNVFTGNNFIDNLSPLTIVGKKTGSSWSVSGTGNYWSSYDGYDLDGDGRGDVPMKILNVFQYLEGQNSNVALYLYSPSSQALASASKAFPVIEINQEADTDPLMRPADMSALPAVKIMTEIGRSAPGHGGPGSRPWGALPLIGGVVAGLVYRRLSRRVR